MPINSHALDFCWEGYLAGVEAAVMALKKQQVEKCEGTKVINQVEMK